MPIQPPPSYRLEDQVFRALASPEIRLLLEYFQKGDRNDKDIEREMPVAAGSRMLMRNLVDLGLVKEVRGRGGSVYRLDQTGLDAARRWLAGMRAGTPDSPA